MNEEQIKDKRRKILGQLNQINTEKSLANGMDEKRNELENELRQLDKEQKRLEYREEQKKDEKIESSKNKHTPPYNKNNSDSKNHLDTSYHKSNSSGFQAFFLALLIIAIIFCAFYFGLKYMSKNNIGGKAGEASSSCVLTDAYWSEANVLKDEKVFLEVKGTNCEGEQISFEIWEKDIPIQPDEHVSINPQPAIFSNGIARGNWTAEYVLDIELIPLPPPEYYFIAYLISNPQIKISSDKNISLDNNPEQLINVFSSKNLSLINIFALLVRDKSATIYWATDKEANSQINYGKTNSYDKKESRQLFLTHHKITLINLDPDTTYHYKITSGGINGEINSSNDYTFKTSLLNASEIIVDNLDPEFSTEGEWEESDLIDESYAENSLTKLKGDGSGRATWSFNIPQNAEYEVFAWWTSYLRATDATYSIETGNRIFNISKNQNQNPNKWNFLGTFNFTKAQHSIYLSDLSNNPGEEITFSADAVKLVLKKENRNCSQENGNICDETQMCTIPYLSNVTESNCCMVDCIDKPGPPLLRVVPQNKVIKLTETISTSIEAKDMVDLMSFWFNITYDKSILNLFRISKTDFMGVDCLVKNSTYVNSIGVFGSIYLSCAKEIGTGVFGTGNLLILDFAPVYFGETYINLSNVRFTNHTTNFPVIIKNSKIQVSTEGCIDSEPDSYYKKSIYCPIGNDCDDTNELINPDAAEICDGIDNNCDGQIDENLIGPYCEFSLGVCSGARKSCGGATGWLNCTPINYFSFNSSYVLNETNSSCDGIDNDCDGSINEICPCINEATRACGSNIGQCKPGIHICIDSTWSHCLNNTLKSLEICDGKDNDCDGTIDNNLVAPLCNLTLGVCANKTKTCTNGTWMDCTSIQYGEFFQRNLESTCDDKKDNDCDGIIDELRPNDINNCGACRNVCSSAPNTTAIKCQNDKCTVSNCTLNYVDANNDYNDGCEYFCIAANATTEKCDGLDNDCDGRIDETCECLPKTNQTCGLNRGECKSGLQFCLNGTWSNCTGQIGPSQEICDGKDNDCNGIIDSNLIPQPCPLTEGICRDSKKLCGGTEGWLPCNNNIYGRYYAETESSSNCDKLDNDCDGSIDENCIEPPIDNQNNDYENDGYKDEGQYQNPPQNPPPENEVEVITPPPQDNGETTIDEKDGSLGLFFWLLIILLFGGIAGYFIYTKMFKKSTPEPEFIEQPVPEDLEKVKKYIIDVSAMGYTEQEIKDALLSVGWSQSNIHEAFRSTQGYITKPLAQQVPKQQNEIQTNAPGEKKPEDVIDELKKM